MSSDGSQDGGEPQRNNNNINDEGNIINDTVADPSSSVDLSTTQIEQNNVDDSMEVRIKNVMAGMGVNPTQHQSSAVQQLESIFPPSTIGGSNGNLLSSTKPSAAGGGTLSTTNGHGAAPLSQQPSAQDLCLLSLFNNFLTPSDLAMAMNDPNFLMPTPFAPGQNAYTLQQQQRAAAKSGSGVPTVVAPPASVNTGGGVIVPNNVSSLFGGATGGANNNNALQFPQYMLQQQTQQALSQQALLQQLGLGGAVSAPTMPAAASAYGFPSMVPMNPADINFLLAAGAATGGYPGAAAAAAAASLNPHLMSAAAMMGNPTGMVAGGLGPAQFGGSGYPNNMFNNPSTAAVAASAMNPMAQYAATMASSMPQQMVTMDQSSVKMMPSHRGIGNDVTGIGSDSEPMIKSREARWIIRYNELLQFRVDNGHCRVPHGYSANRKLSWWVMNQRAQWSHRNQGRKCWLTNERIKMLNDIGFIWTPHMKRKGDGSNSSSNDNDDKKKDGDEMTMPESMSSENGGEHVGNEIDCEDDFDDDKEKKSTKIKL